MPHADARITSRSSRTTTHPLPAWLPPVPLSSRQRRLRPPAWPPQTQRWLMQLHPSRPPSHRLPPYPRPHGRSPSRRPWKQASMLDPMLDPSRGYARPLLAQLAYFPQGVRAASQTAEQRAQRLVPPRGLPPRSSRLSPEDATAQEDVNPPRARLEGAMVGPNQSLRARRSQKVRSLPLRATPAAPAAPPPAPPPPPRRLPRPPSAMQLCCLASASDHTYGIVSQTIRVPLGRHQT
mmetsp:Transcript_18289/g.40938  ORF Transcript_18289/g.40938 Transcript_18289/m.40938 type:complete len:236 (-) Transcript_18289:76-783(-)